VLDRADAEHPDSAGPFQRRLITRPRLFEDPAQAAGQWSGQQPEPVAAYVPPASPFGPSPSVGAQPMGVGAPTTGQPGLWDFH